jgi:hypothetical protein
MFTHDTILVFVLSCSIVLIVSVSLDASASPFTLSDTTLTISQVDYEGAIYHKAGDPYPHLDENRVKWNTVVEKVHRAVIIENPYIRLTLLPEMGRVYSLVYRPTGHEVFWRNDIVRPGGALNATGWWLWIGGAEYTLPGDEHGTTWVLPWRYRILEESAHRKAIRMEVRETGTGLEETIDVAVYPDRAYYEATIEIVNPTDSTVHYAHWINPQWTPGGRNELTDSTEFIIPTDRILIADRWQPNLGPSPQEWRTSPLRFIRGWKDMGDLMAERLNDGFYGIYSHDEEEGVVRVFDREKTPGVDTWTYGFHTTQIPMGSGAPNKGYAEMWGGTSVLYPDERHPLKPGERLTWTEWMYPFHRTGGLTCANRDVALIFRITPDRRSAIIGVCPSGPLHGSRLLVRYGERSFLDRDFPSLSPEAPVRLSLDLSLLSPSERETLVLTLERRGEVIARCTPELD